jgi:flagellar basal body-associated protein FliL
MPIWLVILILVLVIGISVFVFFYFRKSDKVADPEIVYVNNYHVKPKNEHINKSEIEEPAPAL